MAGEPPFQWEGSNEYPSHIEMQSKVVPTIWPIAPTVMPISFLQCLHSQLTNEAECVYPGILSHFNCKAEISQFRSLLSGIQSDCMMKIL